MAPHLSCSWRWPAPSALLFRRRPAPAGSRSADTLTPAPRATRWSACRARRAPAPPWAISTRRLTEYGQDPCAAGRAVERHPLVDPARAAAKSSRQQPDGGVVPVLPLMTAVGPTRRSRAPRGTLAEHWNGTSWATQATLRPCARHHRRLQWGAAGSASACTAVGGWYINNTPGGNGNTGGAVERHPLVDPADTEPGRCPAERPAGRVVPVGRPRATAAGSYFTSGSPSVTLAEHRDGTSWAIQSPRRIPREPAAVS